MYIERLHCGVVLLIVRYNTILYDIGWFELGAKEHKSDGKYTWLAIKSLYLHTQFYWKRLDENVTYVYMNYFTVYLIPTQNGSNKKTRYKWQKHYDFITADMDI